MIDGCAKLIKGKNRFDGADTTITTMKFQRPGERDLEAFQSFAEDRSALAQEYHLPVEEVARRMAEGVPLAEPSEGSGPEA